MREDVPAVGESGASSLSPVVDADGGGGSGSSMGSSAAANDGATAEDSPRASAGGTTAAASSSVRTPSKTGVDMLEPQRLPQTTCTFRRRRTSPPLIRCKVNKTTAGWPPIKIFISLIPPTQTALDLILILLSRNRQIPGLATGAVGHSQEEFQKEKEKIFATDLYSRIEWKDIC